MTRIRLPGPGPVAGAEGRSPVPPIAPIARGWVRIEGRMRLTGPGAGMAWAFSWRGRFDVVPSLEGMRQYLEDDFRKALEGQQKCRFVSRLGIALQVGLSTICRKVGRSEKVIIAG